MAASAKGISLPNSRNEDRLNNDFKVHIPLEELNLPTVAAAEDKGSEDPRARCNETDCDSDEEEEDPLESNQQQFLGPRPGWTSGPSELITAYAAGRHNHQSWALFGRADGSLDIFCSQSRFQAPSSTSSSSDHPMSPPMSPKALHYPDSRLLTTRLVGRKHRAASAASSTKSVGRLKNRHNNNKRSTSPDAGSLRSSSSYTDLATGLGGGGRRHPRKASATLSISGLEALTSAPPPPPSVAPGATQAASTLLQAPAIVEPSPASPSSNSHALLSKHSLTNRQSIQDTWEEEQQHEADLAAACGESGTPNPFDAPHPPALGQDIDWDEPLMRLARVYPATDAAAALNGFDEPAEVRLVLQDASFSQAAVVLTRSG